MKTSRNAKSIVRQIEFLAVTAATLMGVATTGSAQSWVSVGPPGSNYWTAIACSADGTKLYAASDYNGRNYFFTSTNFGSTWVSNALPAPVLTCTSIAALANGQLLAINTAGGYVFTSTNSGTTWISNNVPPPSKGVLGSAYYIAGSADGTRLIASSYEKVYTSTDSGTTWTANAVPNHFGWGSVASSADGTTLAAGSYFGIGSERETDVFYSTNSGAAWIDCKQAGTIATDFPLPPVGVFAEGRNIASPYYSGLMWSTNAGSTWDSGGAYILVPALFGAGVNSGTLIAQEGDRMAISHDGGATWIITSIPGPSIAYQAVGFAVSADGTRWMAAPSSYSSIQVLIYPPSLAISESGGNLVMSWPAPSTGWSLKQNANLATTNWSNVTNNVVVANYQNQVTIPPQSAGQMYYRLAGP